MLHDHTKILSAAFDLAPHSKTTTFCLGFCLHPSSMELPYTEKVNSGTIRRRSGPAYLNQSTPNKAKIQRQWQSERELLTRQALKRQMSLQ